jgi:hypothetical protein
MMHPHALILGRILSPPTRSPSLRKFTEKTSIRFSSKFRPQLPFLSVPATTRQRVRYLTTERKAWLKYELKLSIKYTLYFWAAVACLAASGFAIRQEWLERRYPTPHEWRFLTRAALRGAYAERDRTDVLTTDWVEVIQLLRNVLDGLEDPKKDGKGVKNAPSDDPAGGKDISAMSEPWRRGYYEAIMAYAKAAENLEGWVVDRTRKIVFPPEVVLGPSNPRPKPIPPGAKSAPREEDCELAYPSPDEIYQQILSTEGLTTRQRMDADLAYASWLEYKGLPGPANIIYEDAVYLAALESPSPTPLDQKSWVLNEHAGKPSANLLKSLTSYATFRARHNDVASALPILISILKAHRSLPVVSAKPASASSQVGDDSAEGMVPRAARTIMGFVQPPAYPPPPDDGSSPPIRDARELCEEAGLYLHIGEIIYTANSESREEGLSWTREAVDLAEEQLHKLGSRTSSKAARTTCRECLSTGLGNWAEMVGRLAREEETKKQSRETKSSGWLGLWGEGTPENLDRWAAEEKVIQERTRRVQDLLEDLDPPAKGVTSIFQA